ncbi:transglycosylase SLT domain-containing protein [Kitasatospora sp. NPDC058965]|uniref:transglycosylase SLT domain-containing protein n=1 Tax=Kitasatospora sp. NPDC058965 TaxID=3346682 RepID=UPI003699C3E3
MRQVGRAVAAIVAVLALGLLVHGVRDKGGATAAPSGPASPGTAHSAAPPTAADSAGASPSASGAADYDPARFAAQVKTRAGQAGIDPQLLMAILYNESYKPHDPELERAWQRLKPDSAFGIANMHRAAFDETKAGRDFAGRRWEELPDDPDLALEAAAWFLHDLGAQLPAHRSTGLNQDELMALGYNAGASNMLAFARGTAPGSAAASYLDQLHANWAKAGRALA